MENQHRLMKGYRDLTQVEIDLINECKELDAQCEAMVAKLRATAGLDQRFISIGHTDLQKGWMAVIRGIGQPTTI